MHSGHWQTIQWFTDESNFTKQLNFAASQCNTEKHFVSKSTVVLYCHLDNRASCSERKWMFVNYSQLPFGFDRLWINSQYQLIFPALISSFFNLLCGMFTRRSSGQRSSDSERCLRCNHALLWWYRVTNIGSICQTDAGRSMFFGGDFTRKLSSTVTFSTR